MLYPILARRYRGCSCKGHGVAGRSHLPTRVEHDDLKELLDPFQMSCGPDVQPWVLEKARRSGAHGARMESEKSVGRALSSVLAFIIHRRAAHLHMGVGVSSKAQGLSAGLEAHWKGDLFHSELRDGGGRPHRTSPSPELGAQRLRFLDPIDIILFGDMGGECGLM